MAWHMKTPSLVSEPNSPKSSLEVGLTGCNDFGVSSLKCKLIQAPGDVIAVFLGCPNPMILRPIQDGRFQIVSECFMHGLNDAICFLGPLPPPWKAIGTMGKNRVVSQFFNPESGEITFEDPRLKPVEEWERFERELDGDDPTDYAFFRHKVTGEVINYDPRLEPEELELRGVPLRKFILI